MAVQHGHLREALVALTGRGKMEVREAVLIGIPVGHKAGVLISYVATVGVDLRLPGLASIRSQCRVIRSHLSPYTVLKLSIVIEVEMKSVISNHSQTKVWFWGRNKGVFA